MCSKRNGGKGWSWEPMEPVFQAVLPVLFGERQVRSAEETVAMKRIHDAVLTVASRIFRAPRFRGVDCDPHVAAQMWFIAIRAAKHSFERDRPFHKYAYSVLSNVCCDLGRRGLIRLTKSMPPDAAGPLATPLELAISREERRRVRRALRRLKVTGRMSGNQRTAIAHKYYRGLSSKEAGRRCGVDAATIDRWLYQARMLLRQQLRKSG